MTAPKAPRRSRISAAKVMPAEIDPILSTPDLSARLGVPVGTLENWRLRGYGPRYFKAGAAVRYRWSAVTEWIAEQEKAAAKNPAA